MPKAALPSPELNIDLLKKDSSSSSSNVAIHWVLTVGRYLVIVTEIIALSTFLLGVFLSKEKNDLKDAINDKTKQVENLQNCSNEDDFCEDKFRKIQSQINLVASIRSSQFENNKVLSEFSQLLPINLALDKLSSDGKTITFSGSFPDTIQLQTMINSFNTSDKINNLDITALSKDKDSLFKFSATATINRIKFGNLTN